MPVTNCTSFLFIQKKTAINSVNPGKWHATLPRIFFISLPSLSVLLEAFFIPGILAGTDLHCVFWDTGNEGFERQLPNRAILGNIDGENDPGIHCDSHLQIAANKPREITMGQVPHRAYKEQEGSGCTTDTAARRPAASSCGDKVGLYSSLESHLRSSAHCSNCYFHCCQLIVRPQTRQLTS